MQLNKKKEERNETDLFYRINAQLRVEKEAFPIAAAQTSHTRTH